MVVRKMILLFVLFLLVAPSMVIAATIAGTIYDENLQPAQDVLVTISTSPQQRVLSKEGHYSFSLQPGNYTLQATYTRAGTSYVTTEQILIEQQGEFVFDLFLLPSLDYELPEELDLGNVTDETPTTTRADLQGMLTRLLLVASFFLLLYFVYRAVLLRTKKVVGEATPLEEQLILLLRKNNNRMTQKEIRKNFPHSEATISVLLAELEEKKVVEKIKKGRTNIIKLL